MFRLSEICLTLFVFSFRYFPYIYNISGTMASYKKFGAFFSYADCPRGQIFKRDHSKVVDMETMMKLMRHGIVYFRLHGSLCNDGKAFS